jgi:hypothetical protein
MKKLVVSLCLGISAFTQVAARNVGAEIDSFSLIKGGKNRAEVAKNVIQLGGGAMAVALVRRCWRDSEAPACRGAMAMLELTFDLTEGKDSEYTKFVCGFKSKAMYLHWSRMGANLDIKAANDNIANAPYDEAWYTTTRTWIEKQKETALTRTCN